MVRRVRTPEGIYQHLRYNNDWSEFLRSPMPTAPKKKKQKKTKKGNK